jgi:hypothetical protein
MEYLDKLMKGSNVEPPAICSDAFEKAFSNALNPEWYFRDGCYESVFYQDKLEHIAIFESTGRLLEHKMYLPEEFLPDQIKKKLRSRGEIMNAVLINKGNLIEYEAIIRDASLTRYLITCSHLGVFREEKIL